MIRPVRRVEIHALRDKKLHDPTMTRMASLASQNQRRATANITAIQIGPAPLVKLPRRLREGLNKRLVETNTFKSETATALRRAPDSHSDAHLQTCTYEHTLIRW